MKRKMKILFLSTLVLGMMGCNSSKKNEMDTKTKKLHLVVAHNQTSEENPYHYGIKKFKEEIERISSGNITVELHAGDIGTNESELIEKLSLGALDIAVASPGFMTAIGVKEIDVLSLYYMFENYSDWEKVMDGKFGNKMKDIILDKTNQEFLVLDYWSSGARNFYGKKPINTIKDLKNMRIRTQSSPVQKEFWSNAGAIPTSVDWNELYQGLQQGIVDGAENDMTNLGLKDHHKTKNGKYVTETEHDFTTRLFLINGIKFEKYTKEQQEWIKIASKVATREERDVTYKKLEESRKKIINDGGIINTIDKAEFIESAKPIQKKFAEENNLIELLELINEDLEKN